MKIQNKCLKRVHVLTYSNHRYIVYRLQQQSDPIFLVYSEHLKQNIEQNSSLNIIFERLNLLLNPHSRSFPEAFLTDYIA